MKDADIQKRITDLVEEERNLYGKDGLSEEDKSRLDAVQVNLDQCWDLLRQRRARREFGENPDQAQVRPPETVENYEQ